MARPRRLAVTAAPRLAETPSGLLNSVGLQGPGVDAFLQRDLPWLLSRGARVVVSIAGRYDIPVQASVDVPMACGTGVCMGCVLPVTGTDGITRIVRSCVDGPVFRADLVRWDDLGTIPFDAVGAPGWPRGGAKAGPQGWVPPATGDSGESYPRAGPAPRDRGAIREREVVPPGQQSANAG